MTRRASVQVSEVSSAFLAGGDGEFERTFEALAADESSVAV
ncbi:hypothetical protein [Streptomyces buecherae]|nr:hypothetical protein [Streptomyces buecherae]